MLLIIAEADARTSFASNILQRLQSFTKYTQSARKIILKASLLDTIPI
jgi:hypothetical protein